MKKISRILLLSIFVCLLLGQLGRLTLTSQLAFYFHDFLIIIFILLNLPAIFSCLRPHLSTVRFWLLVFLAIFVIFLPWFLQPIFPFVALIYTLRLSAYLTFLLLVWHLRLFSSAEFSLLFLIFFLTFTCLGLGQYFLFPDARLLQYLGWDDHYYRLLGSWFDPAFSSLVFVFALIFIFFTRKKMKLLDDSLFFYFCLILFFIALVLTYSRSSYLALFVVTCLGLGQYFVHKKNFLFLSAKKWFLPIFLFSSFMIVALVFLTFRFPSDSTNLLRFNSISIRGQMFLAQLNSLSFQDWLIGKGLFVPLAINSPSVNSSLVGLRQVAAFPDNFILLLISFFGLPLALLSLFYLWRLLAYLWHQQLFCFYLFVALLVNAQFNQSFFQPFLFLLTGLLLTSFYYK